MSHMVTRKRSWVKCRPKIGFTLIELLVVIAIISLLVSILLPSLTKAKELAKSIACIANIRSMAMGAEFFASEHAKYPPISYITPGGNPLGWSTWAHFIYKYAGGDDTFLSEWNTDKTYKYHPIVAYHDVYICPSATTSGWNSFAVPDDGRIQGIHYAYSDLRYQIYGGGQYGIDSWLAPGDIPDTANIRMFCDSDRWYTMYHADLEPAGEPQPYWSRHRGGINVGFWDGHAEFVTNEAAQDPDSLMDGKSGGYNSYPH